MKKRNVSSKSKNALQPKRFGTQGGIHPDDLLRLRIRLNAPGDLDTDLKQAIERLQTKFALPNTGQLDPATDALLSNLPMRTCGHIGTHRMLSLPRQQGNPWGREELTFGFGNLPNNSPEIDTVNEAAAAFQEGFSIWSQQIHMSFRHRQNEPDIVIWWGTPGCGGIACTSLPQDGDMMYASWEVWARTATTFEDRVDIVAFACHEVGHALGLDDSDTEEAMMYGRIPNGRRRLIQEDVDNAVALNYRRR
ncbi:MAG: matrixin family metalloprotease [Acidobacteriota bacterium]